MVKIHLKLEGTYVLALSVPLDDMKRLSLRPLKYLRFVAFAICGVTGHLALMPDGPALDYDVTDLDDSDDYYYTPDGNVSSFSLPLI